MSGFYGFSGVILDRGAVTHGLLVPSDYLVVEEIIPITDLLEYQPAIGRATAIGVPPIVISIRSLTAAAEIPEPSIPFYVDEKLPPRIASMSIEQEEPELELPRQGTVSKPGPRIAAVTRQIPSPQPKLIIGTVRRISPRISSAKKGD